MIYEKGFREVRTHVSYDVVNRFRGAREGLLVNDTCRYEADESKGEGYPLHC